MPENSTIKKLEKPKLLFKNMFIKTQIVSKKKKFHSKL
jgi:hypothetical protein